MTYALGIVKDLYSWLVVVFSKAKDCYIIIITIIILFIAKNSDN